MSMRTAIAARAWIFAIGVVAGVTVAARAGATPNYPDVVAAALGLSVAPPCALCHDGGRTGLGTVTTPFGKSLRAHGAVARDDGSVESALHAMEADGTSSLHDGVSDVSKLKKGLDPNGGDSSAISADPPAYGCGGRISRQRVEGLEGVGGAGWLVPIAFVVALALRRRKVRRTAVARS